MAVVRLEQVRDLQNLHHALESLLHTAEAKMNAMFLGPDVGVEENRECGAAHVFGSAQIHEDLLQQLDDFNGLPATAVRTEMPRPRSPGTGDHPKAGEGSAPVRLDVPAFRPVLERLVEGRTVALDSIGLLQPGLEIGARAVQRHRSGEAYHEGHSLVLRSPAVEVAAYPSPEIHALADVYGRADLVLELVDAGSRREVVGYPIGNWALAPAHVRCESWLRRSSGCSVPVRSRMIRCDD